MRIDEDAEVAGYPIKAIRKALRWPARRHHGQVETRRLATELGVDDAEAARAAEGLVEAGYLTRSGWDDIWELTNDALRLACSRLGPPIPRVRAWAALQEMLDRADEVNASEDYLYWVEHVVLFGSLTDATQTTVGDVDVAAELRKRPSLNTRLLGFNAAVKEHERVMRRLKNRSRFLSLIDWSDGVLEQVEPEVVYRREPRWRIPHDHRLGG
ncbi:MAG TPA: hypothetical protein VM142_12670 [Acidimicrobiales bacterium]|nr:hypothetical protein [Acidimicrobiales bacterium]